MYNSLTLACGGEENDVITWKFSQNSDLSTHQDLTSTYSSMETGLSWLDVDNTKQGYYQCQISSSSYTVGVYDTSVTTGNCSIVRNPIVVYYLDICFSCCIRSYIQVLRRSGQREYTIVV